MTAHGPEAMRLVGNALTAAGILAPRDLRVELVATALRVADHDLDRDAGVDALERAITGLDRRYLTKLLDLAVEALTAQE